MRGESLMPSKKDLLWKLQKKPTPQNFTTQELDALMSKCGCKKYPGGRGSSIRYVHEATKRVLQFDGPHPRNELYRYHIKMVIEFLKQIEKL